MADEFDAGDAMPGKKLLFKWKNYQQQTHCFSQNFQTSRPPGPYLRSDEIGDRDPMAVQAPGQAEIEVGEINENGGRRAPAHRFGFQPSEQRQGSRNLAQSLRQAHDGQFGAAGQKLDAGLGHGCSAQPEQFARSTHAQAPGELGGVSDPGGIACGNQEGGWGQGKAPGLSRWRPPAGAYPARWRVEGLPARGTEAGRAGNRCHAEPATLDAFPVRAAALCASPECDWPAG